MTDDELRELARGHLAGQGPVTVAAFMDPAGDESRQAFQDVQRLLRKYQGQVKFVFHFFPGDADDAEALRAAKAAEAAAQAGSFWPFVKLLTEAPGRPVEEVVERMELDAEQRRTIQEALGDGEQYAEEVRRDVELGRRVGVTEPPTFFVEGERVPTADYEAVKDAIQVAVERHAQQVRAEGERAPALRGPTGQAPGEMLKEKGAAAGAAPVAGQVVAGPRGRAGRGELAGVQEGALKEFLNGALMWERRSAELARRSVERADAQGLRNRLRDIADETRRHVSLLERATEELGGAPSTTHKVTGAVLGMAKGFFDVTRTGRTRTLLDVQDVLLAEQKSLSNWRVLETVAGVTGLAPLQRSVDEVLQEKARHVDALEDLVMQEAERAFLKTPEPGGRVTR